LKKLYERHIPPDAIKRIIESLPTDPIIVDCIRELAQAGVDVRILSDANTAFIDMWLAKHALSKLVHTVVSNPAHFDGAACLRLAPYTQQSTCPLCPCNLCKGDILRQWLLAEHLDLPQHPPAFEPDSPSTSLAHARVVYVGDGAGDLCPSLVLHAPWGAVLPRDGYVLARMLRKRFSHSPHDGQVPPVIIPWRTGIDLKRLIEEFLGAKRQP